MTGSSSEAAPDEHISFADGVEYWSSIPPTVHGMLGGYPQISRIDLKGSANFLEGLKREHPVRKPILGSTRALDCGAGIGRITAGFLSKVCDTIDIVEPIQKFADEAEKATLAGKGQVGDVYVCGLQDWTPGSGVMYDLIWFQWCVGHLTDTQFVDVLMGCKATVRDDGWMVVKENVSTDPDGKDIFDTEDSSVTRTHEKFLQIFEKAGLICVKTEVQRGFPINLGLYPVRFYALRDTQR